MPLVLLEAPDIIGIGVVIIIISAQHLDQWVHRSGYRRIKPLLARHVHLPDSGAKVFAIIAGIAPVSRAVQAADFT